MMRDTGSIAAPARSLAEIANAWDMVDAKEQRTVAEFRAAKAKLLIEARNDPKWGARGDGFVDFVEKRLGIAYSTAFDWMKAAGWKAPKQPGAGAKPDHSESRNEGVSDAGIVKRPARVEPEEPREIEATPVRAKATEPEPMPDDERAALVAQLHREEEERRQAALAPLRMESRETAHAKVLDTVETCIAAINTLHAEGIDATACTTSTTEHERVKARLLTLYRMVGQELARIGIEASAEPPAPSQKRQLTLVPGDI